MGVFVLMLLGSLRLHVFSNAENGFHSVHELSPWIQKDFWIDKTDLFTSRFQLDKTSM